MKQEGKAVLADTINTGDEAAVSAEAAATAEPAVAKVNAEPIGSVAFACDAGLGSSAMGATAFRKRLKNAGVDIEVRNYAIENVPETVDVIVTHEGLLDRAEQANPGKRIVTIHNFLKDPNINDLYEEITAM